jgi:hypothetical protein
MAPRGLGWDVEVGARQVDARQVDALRGLRAPLRTGCATTNDVCDCSYKAAWVAIKR